MLNVDKLFLNPCLPFFPPSASLFLIAYCYDTNEFGSQRRQRQARRFAKWLKQRQRKENRQQLKEQRSGLFVNEEKVKLEVSAEEVEVDV